MLSCSTRLESSTCSFLIERRSPTVLLVRIEGHDVGEFGALPMRCLEALLPPAGGATAELFVDARATRGATIDVSNDWALWLGQNRARFHGIRMLSGSKFVHFTAEFVRRFSELEGLMQVYSAPAEFDAALATAAPPP